jgi:anti-anti-sigma regulatory factor
MLLITSNKSKQLMQVSFIGHMRVEQFKSSLEDLKAQLKELSPGFHYLVDFSPLESMGLDCLSELGGMMDLIGAAGVGLVVRVIPDPGKDIGMNILTIFHYPHRPKIVTCENMGQAARALAL